ncbi:MAG: hypothetical protein IJD97_08945 [Clostridia bacterium]|nr:hypothetical protein [Clostridia bacterium]
MLGKSYILVVIGILLAKGLGFFRDMAFAGVFGTGTEADIYSQVFGLVNLIFTGIGVALSTLVIKNLNKEENAGCEKSYAASFLRKSILALTVAALAVALLAEPIVNAVLPGLSAEEFDLAVKMMYLMAPSLVFVVVAYIVSGLLQNKKVYFITSIMSLPFNVAIIAALLFENVDIMAVALVTTIGWFFHIVIQLPAFYKKGYSFLEKKDKSLIKKDKSPEILWIFISNMMFQLCVYIDRAFVGDAATFNYASNLFITISSVFVVAMSTVVFPSISKNYEEGQITYVNELVQYIITIMVAIFLPFLLVVGFFGEDVIRLVYERGEFTSESTLAVSKMFFIYSLGVLGYVAQELFNKILYLAEKYKYTVIGTVAVVVANVGINLGIKASPLSENPELTSVLTASSTSVLLTLYAVAIAVGMRKVTGPYFQKGLLTDIGKIAVSGALATAVYVVFNVFLKDFTHGYMTFLVPLAACGVTYIAGLYFTGILKRLMKREREEVK